MIEQEQIEEHENYISYEHTPPPKKLRRRSKAKSTLVKKSAFSSKRRSPRALSFGTLTYEKDKTESPFLTLRRGHVIPANRDSVTQRNEFMPTISGRVDKQNRTQFAWID